MPQAAFKRYVISIIILSSRVITFLLGGKNSMKDVSVTLRPPRRCSLPVLLNNGNAGSGNEINQALFLK